MRFIAYLVSALATFFVLIFSLANWIYIDPHGMHPIGEHGLNIVFHSQRTGAISGYLILMILFFAFCIFIVSVIPKIMLRRILIPIFGVFSICVLLYFALNASDDLSPGRSISLGFGWYATLIAMIVAILGAFIPKAKKNKE